MIYFNIFAPKVLVHQIEPNILFRHGVTGVMHTECPIYLDLTLGAAADSRHPVI